MLQVARWRIILVTFVTLWGMLFALPNMLSPQMRESLPAFMPREAINLGLDLQGGSDLLLEVDVATLQRQQLDNIADSMAQALRDTTPAIRYTGRGVVADAARLRLNEPTDMARAMQALRTIVEQTRSGASLEFTRRPG